MFDFLELVCRAKKMELKKIPVVLVRNKCDLEVEDLREMYFQEGNELAEKHGIGFVETSAMKGNNVEKAFEMICKEVWIKKDGLSFLRSSVRSKEIHHQLAKEFRTQVFAFVIALKRKEISDVNMKLPKPILLEIVKLLFEMGNGK